MYELIINIYQLRRCPRNLPLLNYGKGFIYQTIKIPKYKNFEGKYKQSSSLAKSLFGTQTLQAKKFNDSDAH